MSGPSEVEPYLDQVSGHSCLLQHEASGVVLKPLYTREHHFYQHMPHDMRSFTPAFIGTAEVVIQADADDHVVFVTCHKSSNNNGHQGRPHANNHSAKRKKQIRRLTNESIEVTYQDHPHPSLELSKSPGGATSLTASHVLWNLKLLHKLLLKDEGHPHKFLVLEDLTSGLLRPCVMDIKMGTRQHSDDATEQKRINQIRKCQDTTSSSLGIRICGMKVYQGAGPRDLWCDKYYGRTLVPDGVESILSQFLHNGAHFRLDVLDHILHKLKHILEVVSSKEDFRFYSSSILITYEGLETQHQPCGEPHDPGILRNNNHCASWSVDKECIIPEEGIGAGKAGVHLVDFELVTHRDYTCQGVYHEGPDQGLLFGLNNLAAILERIKHRGGAHKAPSSASSSSSSSSIYSSS